MGGLAAGGYFDGVSAPQLWQHVPLVGREESLDVWADLLHVDLVDVFFRPNVDLFARFSPIWRNKSTLAVPGSIAAVARPIRRPS